MISARLLARGAVGLLLALTFGGQGEARTGNSSTPADSPVALPGALSVKGNQVVDTHRKPVALHGMRLFWSQAAPQYYSAETIDWLA